MLVFWEASRGTRGLREYLDLRDLCEREGILWSYGGQTYDLRKSADRRRATEDAVRSESESDQTRDRVLRAVRASAAKGLPHGKVPYGYRRRYDPKTRVLLAQEPDEGQAAAIREAARRVLSGEACYAVARDFAARGLPAPGGKREWHPTTVRRLLLNPTYVGQRVHQGRVVGDAAWPAVLDAGTALRLRELLTDPARRTTTHEGAIRHLLSGIVVCGVCGGYVCVQKNRGYHAYLCKNVFEIDHEDWRAPTGAARGREPAGGPSGRPSPTSPWLRSAPAAARN
ncbi:MAG TPA: recombinase family protein, partial [Mycobacteriales bacterium]|nr:recombinase family protein [Mycobacteriales bacterium]